MQRTLTIYSMPNVKIADVLTYRGEPVEVLAIAQRKRIRDDTPDYVTVKPVEGGRKFRVTREDLIEREKKLSKAQNQFVHVVRTVRETRDFLFFPA